MARGPVRQDERKREAVTNLDGTRGGAGPAIDERPKGNLIRPPRDSKSEQACLPPTRSRSAGRSTATRARSGPSGPSTPHGLTRSCAASLAILIRRRLWRRKCGSRSFAHCRDIAKDLDPHFL